MKTSIVGYPRIGKQRQLKFAIEKYWKGVIDQDELLAEAKKLRSEHWLQQQASGIEAIPSNVFSLYDSMLDTSMLLHAIPKAYQDLNLNNLDTYFAMARGYQGKEGDITALAMKKWFNTNYHYLVPEFDDHTEIGLHPEKLLSEYEEALALGIETRPVVVGPFTFYKLAIATGEKAKEAFLESIIVAFGQLLQMLHERHVAWVQFDEPVLVMDLSQENCDLFASMYKRILAHRGDVKVLLQTYFGDVRDCYETIMTLPFAGVGLDFVEGEATLKLVKDYGFPNDKQLFAGLVNGKNIWKCDYRKVLEIVHQLSLSNVVMNTSCSLQHVPYTVVGEAALPKAIRQHFSFAEEKLEELQELSILLSDPAYEAHPLYQKNQDVIKSERILRDEQVCRQVEALSSDDFIRLGKRTERQKIQKTTIGLDILPTTTIGSFPQTQAVKANRARFKKGEISQAEYDQQVYKFIAECIALQEQIGLDVLVHGEYERNDMVEFFGENLNGYVFTQYAWVQSYGTRCLKPPIIFGDIKRNKPITVPYSAYAKSLSKKPMKGMLTGPVTILNWSFPREDVSLKTMALQIGLAIRQEVLDLEAAGIEIIQIDEAAFREKLPLRKKDWHSKYLIWALQAFRLCHSGVKQTTQIHTHMCYSEFEDIIQDIDAMDADVITFEASRSKLTLLDVLKRVHFESEVGPGVYDIHSPRVPTIEELVAAIMLMMDKVNPRKLWINPDCGLKTRGEAETIDSLKHMVEATKIVRKNVWNYEIE